MNGSALNALKKVFFDPNLPLRMPLEFISASGLAFRTVD